MKNLTAEVAAILTGAQCRGRLPAGELSAITTDSRSVVSGSLFAAIPGERVDGHDFLPAAMEKGAVCALVERPVDCALPQLIVPSTEEALQALAAYYRRQLSLPVIGVTGSVGKTTAKEMIASVLAQRFNTLKTEKNFNNELGVPFTLFRLRPEHEAAVVEMGISDFGEMTRLARMVKPDIAVFTLIGDAHLEFLHDREGVLKAKSEVVSGMAAEGLVLANGDDPLLRAHDFGRETLLFGFGAHCDLRAVNVHSDGEGSSCELVGLGRHIPVRIPAYGQHMVYAALMGAAVGLRLGLSDEEIAAGIAGYEPVGHRSRVLKTGRWLIVDDCYNSNPTSATSAVRSLLDLGGHPVAILGDMLELGEQSEALHHKLGAFAAENGVLVVACGEQARAIAEGAGDSARWFETTAELITALPELVTDGDSILVKASRRLQFEDITDALVRLG